MTLGADLPLTQQGNLPWLLAGDRELGIRYRPIRGRRTNSNHGRIGRPVGNSRARTLWCDLVPRTSARHLSQAGTDDEEHAHQLPRRPLLNNLPIISLQATSIPAHLRGPWDDEAFRIRR